MLNFSPNLDLVLGVFIFLRKEDDQIWQQPNPLCAKNNEDLFF